MGYTLLSIKLLRKLIRLDLSLQFLLENLQVLLESDIILLVGNIQFWGIIQVDRLFLKLWPLLYKRAKLDLRLTKSIKTVRKLIKFLSVENRASAWALFKISMNFWIFEFLKNWIWIWSLTKILGGPGYGT